MTDNLCYLGIAFCVSTFQVAALAMIGGATIKDVIS